MSKYIVYAWGVAGIRAPIADTTQPSGVASWQSGFTADYTLNPATNPSGKPVPLAPTNQYLFDISSGVQQYQQNGFPAFITTADNLGTPYSYSQNAVVSYLGKLYMSRINANTSLPTVGTAWALMGACQPALVAKSGNQSIGTSSTLVTFDTINYDLGSLWTGAPDYKFTAPVSGVYQVYAMLRVANPTVVQQWQMSASASSGYVKRLDLNVFPAVGVEDSMTGSVGVPLNAGEYVQLTANMAAAAEIVGGGVVENYFGINFISPL